MVSCEPLSPLCREIVVLCDQIQQSQRQEIDQMRRMLERY